MVWLPLSPRRIPNYTALFKHVGCLSFVLFLTAFVFQSYAAAASFFGTVELKMTLEKQENWPATMQRHAKNTIFKAQVKLSGTDWQSLKMKWSGLDEYKKLEAVNRFWNQWPYKTDLSAYGKKDYWAAPYEFVRHSGDCEDYSISKYYTLRELGFPQDRLRILVVRETVRNIGHAILGVIMGDDIFILDNLANTVVPMRFIRNYEPQFSLNESYRWVHLKPSKKKRK